MNYFRFVLNKKSYKLTFREKSGGRDEELLSMGSDDDWILNAMSGDDTKLKEKLSAEIWNDTAAKEEYNYPMSEGKYTELIINGSYEGLYMLQRKVEPKFLGLDGEYLFKGYAPPGTDIYSCESFEMVSPLYSGQEKHRICREIFDEGIFERIDPRNLADVNIFLAFASACDNAQRKNMFYIVNTETDTPYTTLVPWDTDWSYGMSWNGGLEYNKEYMLSVMPERMETDKMCEIYPELDRLTAGRWFELRKNELSLDSVLSRIEAHGNALDNSGALIRDRQKWGLSFGGEDSREAMCGFIAQRLEILDRYYSDFLS